VPYLFQKYVKESHGKDIRVVVVGGQVIGSMLRCSTDGRMQSNCFLGKTGKAWGGWGWGWGGRGPHRK
jgi:glutathione synthase/RimK-type ligase-like ATP-grasp enzyme